jgi:hypothetical protein
LVDPAVWHGIMHLPEDVSIRISDHNGLRLRLMYQFWGDWVEAIGDPNNPDEIFNCLLEAADRFGDLWVFGQHDGDRSAVRAVILA